MTVENIIGKEGDNNALDNDINYLKNIIKLLQDFLSQICEPWEIVAFSEVVHDDDDQMTLRNMKLIPVLYGP